MSFRGIILIGSDFMPLSKNVYTFEKMKTFEKERNILNSLNSTVLRCTKFQLFSKNEKRNKKIFIL